MIQSKFWYRANQEHQKARAVRLSPQLEYEILLFLGRLEHPQPAMYSPSPDSTPMQKELPLLILPYVCTVRYSAPNDS